MIVTREQDKMTGPVVLLAPDTQMWRRAHIELAIPYFFLSYDVAQGDGWIGHTELYWELDKLLHCCAQIADDERLRLSQIALISPGWMNGRGGWQMDTVKEIWRGRGASGQPVVHYVSNADNRLNDAMDETASNHPLVKLLAVDESGLFVLPRSSMRMP